MNILKYLTHFSALFFALLLVTSNTDAQAYDFDFDEDLNVLIAKKDGKSPYAFELLKEKFTRTYKEKDTKRESSFYKKALAFQEKAKNDSIKITQFKKEKKPIIGLNEADVNDKLRVARRTLKNTNQYEIIPGEMVTEVTYKLKVRRNVFKPENVIVGKFKDLGLYYVIKSADGGLTESDLISVKEAQKKGLTNKNFLFPNYFNVILSLETDVAYMVFPEFLMQYPINKLASQEKYNSSVAKNSTSESLDDSIDAIIIDYKRKNN